MPQKIVLTGAPGTGKSTIINLLRSKGYFCQEEISREIIKEAERMGSKKLFLSQPILFSKVVLGKRIIQYQQANNNTKEPCFFDRGIPDITAYLNKNRIPYEETFKQSTKKYTYDTIFVFPPWEQIYTTDSERFETFEEAKELHFAIVEEYKKTHQNIIVVPFGSPQERLNFILKKCHA
ncbi:AAA family ATPase [Wenyingzhuangia aestuarii]|uniref:AAA family ATPase n=1 Tax=Wenyingzhuangia aestuarii TaxID=1647582 RepID=UPI00143BFBCA|nr:AAA family ATPase [Wenyingzhuangia aestuarii]NJB82866.1 putative ATPase [Wenyingzhuangia aestuarii]